MLRLVSTAVLATSLSVPLVSAAGPEPPSSIESAHGTVKLLHTASRVSACVANKAGASVRCEPKLQPMDASLHLTFTPVDETAITNRRKRSVATASCPKDSGQVVAVDLAAGVWRLELPGGGAAHRFYLGDGDELDIAITSQRGSCKRSKGDCVLETSGVKRDVKVPSAARR